MQLWKLKVLLHDQLVHIKHHTYTKSRYIELVNLLIARIGIWDLEEVLWNLGSNEKYYIFYQNINGEYIPQLGILFSEHHNRKFQKLHPTSNNGPCRDPGMDFLEDPEPNMIDIIFLIILVTKIRIPSSNDPKFPSSPH